MFETKRYLNIRGSSVPISEVEASSRFYLSMSYKRSMFRLIGDRCRCLDHDIVLMDPRIYPVYIFKLAIGVHGRLAEKLGDMVSFLEKANRIL